MYIIEKVYSTLYIGIYYYYYKWIDPDKWKSIMSLTHMVHVMKIDVFFYLMWQSWQSLFFTHTVLLSIDHRDP